MFINIRSFFSAILLTPLLISLSFTQPSINVTSENTVMRRQFLLSELPFSIGERLRFRLRYGFIKAGEAEMKVLSLSKREQDSVPYFHLQTTARSVSTFDLFYKVRDVVNSYLRADWLASLRFEKKLREGGYKADTFVDYSHHDSLARVEYIRFVDDNKIKKHDTYEVKIPPGVFDALSALYYVRTMDLVPGESVFITAHEKRKVYDLEIRVLKREKIKVRAGKFRCLLIEPIMAEEGIFKSEGKLNIWLTDDDLKIPVQMTTKVVVGHITAELEEISGIYREIPARLD